MHCHAFRSLLVLIAFSCAMFLLAPHTFAADNAPQNLIPSAQFQTTSKPPANFDLSGNITFGPLDDLAKESNGHGFRLRSTASASKPAEGRLSVAVKNLKPTDGRWFRLRIRAQAQDAFAVAEDDLYLRVDFFRDAGANPLDHIKKEIFSLIERDRKSLLDPGTSKRLGRAVWRSFDMEFHTPFAEVDTLQITVGFGHGKGPAANADLLISEIQLTPIPVPADYKPPAGGGATRGKEAIASMVRLGGRWYFDPRSGDHTAPSQFDYTNSDQLYYLTDRLEAPFQDNMSAWLRKGNLDRKGDVVKEDRFIADNVTITFTATHLVMRSKGLPNHPTAIYPDPGRLLTGNPNSIQEKDQTFSIPLEPRENPQHIAMKDAINTNNALPMGPIGVAVNGVVFFNPFDAGMTEAIRLLDRCCGHPAPNNLYHYHKYPVCVKSPWADDGSAHSPLIGFAFDGFPIYGPYETKGVLAKDSKENALNEFNLHTDPERGPHYHVTPGKFPHVIGGFWGTAEIRRGPRGGGGPGGPPGGGPPGGGRPPRGLRAE